VQLHTPPCIPPGCTAPSAPARLQALGIDTSRQHAAQLLARYDKDRSGTLEIEEFSKLSRELREWQWAQGQWPRPPPPPKGASVMPKAAAHEEASWRCPWFGVVGLGL